jgi:hypothetical protein
MFILHDVQGHAHDEIPGILDSGLNSWKLQSRLFKARRRLRDLLQEAFRSQAREERATTRSLPVPEQRSYRFESAKS